MRTISIIILLCLSIPLWAEDVPVPRDFAYGAAISVSGEGAVYKASLPELVYGRVTRVDLADIRVFNQNDQIVPHTLRRPVKSVKQKQAPLIVPHFPLYRSATSMEKNTNFPLSVKIATDDKGAVINIDSSTSGSAQQQLYGYLLDTSQLKQIPDKLSFDWADADDNFISTVSVESSNNLTSWSSLVRKSTITRMQYGTYQLDNHIINLPRRKAKYLRVTWSNNKIAQKVNKITLDFPDTVQQHPWQWKTIMGNAHATDQAVYEFDSGAFLPVERVHLHLPERNTLVHVRLLSRSDNEQAWRYRYSGNVYQLIIDGNELNSPDIQLPTVSDRYWRLEVEAGNGGLGNGLPALQLGWLPHSLMFVARGEPPFKLTYGSSTVGAVATPVNSLLRQLEKQNTKELIKQAYIVDHYTLAGPSRLQPPTEELPWKQLILWMVLVLVVIILAVMARQLYRQMQEAEESES